MKFTHLHTHSHYSLLQALPKVPELVAAAKNEGMDALALTDNGNLYGAVEFYKECKKQGVKPIIGVDAYLAGRTLHEKQAGIDKDRYRIILLAKNTEGYKNLLKLVSISHLEGFYYKPRIDYSVLKDHSAGLVAISSSWSGDISSFVRSDNKEKLGWLIDFYKENFSKGEENNFYIELTMHPEINGHNEHIKKLSEFAKDNGLQTVASHDVYYIHKEDRDAKNTLMAVQTLGSGGENDRSRNSFDDDEEDFSFISNKEVTDRFVDFKEALFNNNKVASICNLDLELGKWVFPDLKIESGKSADEELREIAFKGIEKRGLPRSEEVVNRLEYELGIIKTKGYSPYFLVVADLLRFSRENGILSNIRGSVSGSLVTYASGITNINPLEYEIPFERFLNPDRPSAPDIDMDFADDRRDEVLDYARRKYGEEKVAQIGTFGTMMARGSVRDTARALGFPYVVGDKIAKLIPFGSQGFPMSIDRALEETPDLKELYNKDPDTKRIIDMAKKIEGCARHISIHAAGVVISPTSLTDFTALQYDPKGENKIISQYDMYSIEEAGLLKFDFLGLKNLSIISKTLDLVKKIRGIDIDIQNIPIDDKKTFEMLARGETADTFQLNGDGITRFLVELKPSSIHDINAMVALYRPGPMQFIPQYIERRHDPSKVTYMDAALEPILQKTYGILVYQDDLLIMAHNLAGYTWGEVDKFRKAVGKKIPEEMAEQKEKFIRGCISHSKWGEKKAKEVWKWIEPFAAYGFNKAHSVSYGRVAYQTAYLKANFPGEYMRAVLSAESGDVEKVSESVAECKRMGMNILPPDVNESFSDFTLVPNSNPPTIRFGLATIKNFGEGISHVITDERKKGGHFSSLEDFLFRIRDRNMNKKSLEALIKSGALDRFGERGNMLANIELLLEYNKHSSENDNQDSLFAGIKNANSLSLVSTEPLDISEKLFWEKELLGLYVSGHPLDKFKEKLEAQKQNINNIVYSSKENEIVVVGGFLEQAREILTKSGEKMLFGKLSDLSGSIDIVVFPRTYAQFSSIFSPDRCIAVKAKVSLRNSARNALQSDAGGGEKSLIVEKAKRL